MFIHRDLELEPVPWFHGQGGIFDIKQRTRTHEYEMLGWLDKHRDSPINRGHNNRYTVPKKVARAKRKAAKKSKRINRR